MAFATYLQEVAAQAGLKVLTVQEDYLKCSFALPDGRNHTVHLSPAGELGGHQVVRVSTPVLELSEGKLTPQFVESLLRENGQMKIGAFAIEDLQDRQLLILHHNMILDTLDPQEFLIIVGSLALSGDRWEQQLGGGDRF
jgi:hypothetical protein